MCEEFNKEVILFIYLFIYFLKLKPFETFIR